MKTGQDETEDQPKFIHEKEAQLVKELCSEISKEKRQNLGKIENDKTEILLGLAKCYDQKSQGKSPRQKMFYFIKRAVFYNAAIVRLIISEAKDELK